MISYSRFLFIVALLLVCGCARPTYAFEGDWTGDEESAVMAGFEQWAEPLRAQGRELPPVTIKRMDGPCVWTSAHMIEFGYVAPQDIDNGGGTIELWPDCMQQTAPKGNLETVAAHEMGHILGLLHYEGPEPSVMHANSGDDAPTVTAIDLEHLKAYE